MDDKSLNISIYDHFKYYFNTRGTGIITDKQFAFYTQYDINDSFEHQTSISYLNKLIHYNVVNGLEYEDKKDVIVASTLNYFYIFLPTKNTISNEQYKFLMYILDEIEKFNEDTEFSDRKIDFDLFYENSSDCVSTSDISKLKNILSNLNIRDTIDEEEFIIGKPIEELNEDIKKI
jgi:hypothetical protein